MKDAKLFCKVLQNTIKVLSEHALYSKTKLWEELPRVKGAKGGQEYAYMIDALKLLQSMGEIELIDDLIRVDR